MKVGNLIKLKNGTVGIITAVERSPSSGSEYIIIHTGEAFHIDTMHLEGWELIDESQCAVRGRPANALPDC